MVGQKPELVKRGGEEDALGDSGKNAPFRFVGQSKVKAAELREHFSEQKVTRSEL